MPLESLAKTEEEFVGQSSSQLLSEFYVRDARYIRVCARPFGTGIAWETVANEGFAERLPIRKGSPARDTVCLFLGTQGEGEFKHFGHAGTLRERDLLLVDSNAGFSVITAPDHRHHVVQLPMASFGERLRALKARAGRILCGDDPKHAAVYGSLLGLLAGSPYFTREDHVSAQAAAIHLLHILIGAEALALPLAARLYARADTLIERHLHDPCLNAALLARELRISRRQLEIAFATKGMTVANSIWMRRTARAAERMRAGVSTSQTLLEIASSCGFVSAAHFSRRFREQFGVTPSQYRQAHEPSGPLSLPRP